MKGQWADPKLSQNWPTPRSVISGFKLLHGSNKAVLHSGPGSDTRQVIITNSALSHYRSIRVFSKDFNKQTLPPDFTLHPLTKQIGTGSIMSHTGAQPIPLQVIPPVPSLPWYDNSDTAHHTTVPACETISSSDDEPLRSWKRPRKQSVQTEPSGIGERVRSRKRSSGYEENSGTAGTQNTQDNPRAADTRSKQKRTPHDSSHQRSQFRRKAPASVYEKDGISFQTQWAQDKWDVVRARRLAVERPLSRTTMADKDIMKILKQAGMIPLLSHMGPYFPQMVRAFVCHISADIDNPFSPHFHKVIFRNHTVTLSPTVINNLLGTPNEGTTGSELDLDMAVSVITAGEVASWPVRKSLNVIQLSIKHAILHKAVMIGLIPTAHTTSVSERMARVLGALGSDQKVNFGQLIFDQIVDHAKSNATLKPLGFPCLLTKLLKKQIPAAFTDADIPGSPGKPLHIRHGQFSGAHARDVDFGPSSESQVVDQAALLTYIDEDLDLLNKHLVMIQGRIRDLEARRARLVSSDDPSSEEDVST